MNNEEKEYFVFFLVCHGWPLNEEGTGKAIILTVVLKDFTRISFQSMRFRIKEVGINNT